MSKEIVIPDGLRFWFSSESQDKIIDLEKHKKIPPGLGWNEISEYFRARFALSILKMDFYNYLREAWDATWGTALESAKQQCKPLKSDEYVIQNCKPEDWLSPDVVWNESSIYSIWKCNEQYFILGVSLSDAENASLLVFYSKIDQDKESVLTDSVNLKGDYWQSTKKIDKNGYRYSSVAGTQVTTKNSVILDDLCTATTELINSIAPNTNA